MISGWSLPTYAVIGGEKYDIHCDYRDILEIFSYFSDPDLPEFLQWKIALALFYDRPIPKDQEMEAISFLTDFINGGKPSASGRGKALLDWEQDAELIVADINKTAGQEIRALPFLHWWTFLSWFHAIGEGQLSTVVSIREKLSRGKKLEDWEKDYYRDNKHRVDMKKRHSRQELQERQRLEQMLETK